MQKRFATGRGEELLDGVMQIIAARGFSDVRIAEMAKELHCSVASLYKIAPNKDSLVVLAINRWGEQALEYSETCARLGVTDSDKARNYWLGASARLRTLSHEFRVDMQRFESSRMAYLSISNGFVDRFTELLDEAVESGEVRAVNTRFIALVVRQAAIIVRDEQALGECGLTAAEALLEFDQVLWNGIGSGSACLDESK